MQRSGYITVLWFPSFFFFSCSRYIYTLALSFLHQKSPPPIPVVYATCALFHPRLSFLSCFRYFGFPVTCLLSVPSLLRHFSSVYHLLYVFLIYFVCFPLVSPFPYHPGFICISHFLFVFLICFFYFLFSSTPPFLPHSLPVISFPSFTSNRYHFRFPSPCLPTSPIPLRASPFSLSLVVILYFSCSSCFRYHESSSSASPFLFHPLYPVSFLSLTCIRGIDIILLLFLPRVSLPRSSLWSGRCMDVHPTPATALLCGRGSFYMTCREHR